MEERIKQKALELQDRLDTIYETVAERMGMGMTYIQSMNGSLFPLVVRLVLGEEDDSWLNEFQFLAENDFILPETLKTQT